MDATPGFDILFQKLLDNQLSPEEADQLIEWLAARQPDSAAREAVLSQLAASVDQTELSAATLARLEQNLRQILGAKLVKIPARHKWLTRTAVAAAILILLGSAAWFFIAHRQNAQPEVAAGKPFKNDVLPGGNKAILTLASGATVILDSASNGRIALQGNTAVQKLANGQIVYNLVGEKTAAVLYNTLTTPKGGIYQLTLPDGSTVWLNSASSIKYPVAFTSKERLVEITGEACFEVVHNPRQIFTVKAGRETIEDMGTSFNINAYTDEPALITTLVSGKIAVTEGAKKVEPRPGQQSIETYTGLTVTPGDPDRATAWRRGVFSFAHTDVVSLMSKHARWYDVDVKYEGDNPQDQTFTGEMGRNLTLAQVLHGLRGDEPAFQDRR